MLSGQNPLNVSDIGYWKKGDTLGISLENLFQRELLDAE